MAVYDASWQRPSPSLLKPGDGLILYCSRTLNKTPSTSQCDAYRARSVSVGFVFEDSADRAAVQGFAAGVSDGALALTQAKAKGHPRGWTVYFACDVTSPLNLEYARGFRDGLTAYYVPGLYAGDRNLERARVGLGYQQLWQASAASWSDHWGPDHHGTYTHAALWQSAAASPVPGTDLNVVNRAGWNHPLIGTPQDTLEGDDMSAADVAAVNAHTDDVLASIKDSFALVLHGDAGHVANLDNILGVVQSNANRLVALSAKVGTITSDGAVDVPALATALAADLGPDLGAELVAALKAAL
jgi:hypothetical protein